MAHGNLQLAMPMDKVKEISNMSLMVSFFSLLEQQNSNLAAAIQLFMNAVR